MRPVLAERCFGCHGENATAGLRLDSRAGMLTGGKRGAAIVPGQPAASLLVQALRRTGTLKMPPSGALEETQIASIEEWIREGAPWPVVAAKPGKTLWAAEPFPVASGSIDSHVAKGLAAKGIARNPRADRRTILRRVYADLVGLPAPASSPFLEDGDVGKLVDGLLASPQFGERWGRHWLDVARFGEDDFTGTQPGRIRTRGDIGTGLLSNSIGTYLMTDS